MKNNSSIYRLHRVPTPPQPNHHQHQQQTILRAQSEERCDFKNQLKWETNQSCRKKSSFCMSNKIGWFSRENGKREFHLWQKWMEYFCFVSIWYKIRLTMWARKRTTPNRQRMNNDEHSLYGWVDAYHRVLEFIFFCAVVTIHLLSTTIDSTFLKTVYSTTDCEANHLNSRIPNESNSVI